MKVIETSIIGGNYEHFFCEIFDYDSNFPYVFLRIEGEEKPILVKILKFRDSKKRENLRRAEFYRYTSPNEVKHIMTNMVRGIIWENNIPAKVKDSSFDPKSGVLTVEYVSEKPQDFRSIVPFLAKHLHVRVEFVFKDYVKYAQEVGLIDRCGLELCCRVFLKNIPTVSQDMAKRQYLFAAPYKLTGVCGRLLCCLTYELPFYDEVSQKFPKLNSTIKTEKGEGKVVEVNVIAGYYVLFYENGTKEKVKVDI